MPKMKRNSSAKKRFSVTGTGKIKRKHALTPKIKTHATFGKFSSIKSKT